VSCFSLFLFRAAGLPAAPAAIVAAPLAPVEELLSAPQKLLGSFCFILVKHLLPFILNIVSRAAIRMSVHLFFSAIG
jgi:hypothetical protein